MFFIYTSWQIFVLVFNWRANVKFEATIVLDSSMSSSLFLDHSCHGRRDLFFFFLFINLYSWIWQKNFSWLNSRLLAIEETYCCGFELLCFCCCLQSTSQQIHCMQQVQCKVARYLCCVLLILYLNGCLITHRVGLVHCMRTNSCVTQAVRRAAVWLRCARTEWLQRNFWTA